MKYLSLLSVFLLEVREGAVKETTIGTIFRSATKISDKNKNVLSPPTAAISMLIPVAVTLIAGIKRPSDNANNFHSKNTFLIFTMIAQAVNSMLTKRKTAKRIISFTSLPTRIFDITAVNVMDNIKKRQVNEFKKILFLFIIKVQ